MDIVFAALLVTVARNGCSNAEGNQQQWVMHPPWRHLCQSPNVTHHCYCTIRVATCWLYQYWDDDGIRSTHPNIVNVLVFCDHFAKHIMEYVTLDQTAKTVAKFLWQGYISIFGAPARLLSDCGANFESYIIREMCDLMGISKVKDFVSPYSNQQTGGTSSPNTDVHNTEIGKGPEGRLAEAFPQVGACLQLDAIGHHWIQPTLFDVWAMTIPAHQLLFPHGKGHKETPVQWSLCCWVMWTTA